MLVFTFLRAGVVAICHKGQIPSAGKSLNGEVGLAWGLNGKHRHFDAACKWQMWTIWGDIPLRKLTRQWNITIFNRRYIFKCLFFHCHLSFRGCMGVCLGVTLACRLQNALFLSHHCKETLVIADTNSRKNFQAKLCRWPMRRIDLLMICYNLLTRCWFVRIYRYFCCQNEILKTQHPFMQRSPYPPLAIGLAGSPCRRLGFLHGKNQVGWEAKDDRETKGRGHLESSWVSWVGNAMERWMLECVRYVRGCVLKRFDSWNCHGIYQGVCYSCAWSWQFDCLKVWLYQIFDDFRKHY